MLILRALFLTDSLASAKESLTLSLLRIYLHSLYNAL
jgi:hypothetical protein